MPESDSPSTLLRKARESAGFQKASDFAKKHNLTEVTYRSHENGTRPLTMDAAKRYGRILGISWLKLLGDESAQLEGTQSRRVNKQLSGGRAGGSTTAGRPANIAAEDMLRVLGMAEGGQDGWNLFNGDTVQYVPRPFYVAGVPGAYGVYIRGVSMSPKYEPGDIAYMHPGKPVEPGCFVLVQRRNPQDEGQPLAVIKRLVRRTATKVVLAQLNPPKEFDVPAGEVLSIHRVVGSSEA